VDGDLFAAAAVFDRIFGVASAIEWMDLTVFVGRSASLPVSAAPGRPPAGPAPPPLRHRRARVSAAACGRRRRRAQLAFTGSTGARDDFYNLDLGLGAQVGGAVSPCGRSSGGWPARRTPTSRVVGARLARPAVDRQVRVGDVQSNGRRAQFVRGAVVTNAPFIRSSEFDVERSSDACRPDGRSSCTTAAG